MRLIVSDCVHGCSLDNVMILVRHGVDVPVLSQELNQPLTNKTKPDIAKLGREMMEFCKRIDASKVRIDHSNRLRAVQTAAIIAEEFFGASFFVELNEVVGVREIYQGDFIITDHVHGTEYQPLLNAWRVWQQKLDACELDYRFGDPILDGNGIPEYPELVGWFKTFGECQRDFSLRLYSFLSGVFERSDNCLQVVVGHQASSSRIQRIISAIGALKGVDDFRSGEFVKFHEKKGSRITIEPACGVVIKKPNRDLAIGVLQKEIKFLKCKI